jgi:hypothetical protein
MLRYGAMQIDVFTLLLESQQKISINAAAVDALRDFWLASTDLSAVIVGGGTDSAEAANIAMPAPGGATGH